LIAITAQTFSRDPPCCDARIAIAPRLLFAAIGEAATGLALLIVPSLVGELLLGQDTAGVAVLVARVTGIALIALAVACWPGPPLLGMLIYSALVAFYLAYLGFAGGFGGILLWPAVIVHAVLTLFLALGLPRTLRDPGV
jgi:hypothetical protein